MADQRVAAARHPDVGLGAQLDAVKAGRRHADDGEHDAVEPDGAADNVERAVDVEPDGAADNVERAVEHRGPQAIADDRDQIADSRDVVVRSKAPAERDMHAEHVEVGGGHRRA